MEDFNHLIIPVFCDNIRLNKEIKTSSLPEPFNKWVHLAKKFKFPPRSHRSSFNVAYVDH